MTTEGVPMQGQKSWFAKNWYWVALGCLIPTLCCVGGAVVFGIGAAGAVGQVAKGSGAATEAVVMANSNDEVVAELGKPIAAGFPSNTKMNSINGNDTIALTLPITGPKGSGTMRLVASQTGTGGWKYSKLTVEANGKTINLNGTNTELPPEVPDDERQEVPD
jgi:hypothetical protein